MEKRIILEECSFNRTEGLGRAGDYSRQRLLRRRDYIELSSKGRFGFGLPTLFAKQGNKANVGKIFSPKFGFRNARNAHQQLLDADFRADGNY